MKIIKLTMKAFLTYKEEIIVDFNTINNSGLYLISGPTGSGKTSLYDAITFALFGKASGSSRDQSHFRSGFADDKDDTYVELVFEHHNTLYTVKRSPKYLKPGRKTETPAKALLSFNNEAVEGVKEVNEKIESVLGIDVNQFKQIVMIAQGEFTKLIYASSEEREKVLRNIFHSEIYQNFEFNLKNKTIALKNEYTNLNISLNTLFSTLLFNDQFKASHSEFHESYIEDAIKENNLINEQYILKNNEYNELNKEYEKTYDYYTKQQIINKDIEGYHKLKEDYDICLKQSLYYENIKNDLNYLDKIDEHKETITEYNRIKKELNNTINSLKEKEDSYNKVLELYNQYKKEYENINILDRKKQQLQIDLNEIDKLIKDKEEYLKLNKLHKEKTEQYNQLKDNYEKENIRLETLINNIENDKEKIKEIPVLELKIKELEHIIEKHNHKRTQLNKLSDYYNKFNIHKENHIESTSLYEKHYKIYKDYEQSYKTEEEKFKRYQAGILAQELEEGKPCPVCGSLHHPNIAVLKDKVLNVKELDEMKAETERLRVISDKYYNDVVEMNNILLETKFKLDSIKNELEINDDISKELITELLFNLENNSLLHNKECNQYKDNKEYLIKLNNGINDRENKLNQYKSDLLLNHEQLLSYNKDILEIETKISLYDQSIIDTDYKQKYTSVSKEIQTINKNIETIRNNYHTYVSLESKEKQSMILEKDKQKQYKELYEKYHIQFTDIINTHFKTLENYNHYVSIYKDKTSLLKQYNDYNMKVNHLKMSIERINSDIKQKDLIDLTQIKTTLESQKNALNTILEEKTNLENQYKTNNTTISKIQKEYDKNKKISDKYIIYDDLYRMASGHNSSRISFERYVLAYYFERIIDFANIELLKMTSGRYRLIRKSETKGTARQGLDLNVLDYETGMQRDVQSLSGGESFKAALALALGLSSMIQNYAGGIELNTLFIDEGFGSLDQESLNIALSVLMGLQSSNKVIGIISHVEELKERIQTQIVIEKKDKGSSLKIVC